MQRIALCVLLVSTGWAAAAGPARQPRLRLAKVAPLVIEGLDFQPLERVQLRVITGEMHFEQEVRASEQGTFRASFDTRLDRCRASLIATAKGAGGSLARKLLPQVHCPPRPDRNGVR